MGWPEKYSTYTDDSSPGVSMKRRVNTEVQVIPPWISSATADTTMIASGATRKVRARGTRETPKSTAIPSTATKEKRTALNPVLEYSRN
ncbi:hypothetical protein ACIPEQ_04845 [Curtobacterium sp. NPDC087080]|uniref:hypothetical protein n=1 Tax=Curtobacterium sp. NPDC087080 TaxID=3363965 RepID=UPI0037F87349